jgi:hypothetical protein
LGISLEIFVFLFFNLLLFFHYRKVAKRLPYYVTCDEPVIPPDPPKIHMENMETFFYNTIPKRPMAYTIHKEWVSEVIHAKRMELQNPIIYGISVTQMTTDMSPVLVRFVHVLLDL